MKRVTVSPIPSFSHKVTILLQYHEVEDLHKDFTVTLYHPRAHFIISPHPMDVHGASILSVTDIIRPDLEISLAKIAYSLGYKHLYLHLPIPERARFEMFEFRDTDFEHNNYWIDLTEYFHNATGVS